MLPNVIVTQYAELQAKVNMLTEKQNIFEATQQCRIKIFNKSDGIIAHTNRITTYKTDDKANNITIKKYCVKRHGMTRS